MVLTVCVNVCDNERMTDRRWQLPKPNEMVRVNVGHGKSVDGYIIRCYPESGTCFVEYDDGDAIYCDYQDMSWDSAIEGWRY